MNIQQPGQHNLPDDSKGVTDGLTPISSTASLRDGGGQPKQLESAPRRLLPKPTESSQSLSQHNVRPRPLPRLLPRPVPRKPQSQSRPALSGPCGIPQCEQVPCRLVSHRQRVKSLARKSSKETQLEGLARNLTLSRRQSIRSISSDPLQPTIAKNAGFPTLPWTGSPQSDPILRQLFHDFFVKLVNRLLTIIIPPFPGHSEWLRGRHQDLFQSGINEQLDCINFIGAAHAYLTIRSQTNSSFTDPVGIMIHNDLMKHLRDTLEQYEAEKDAEKVLNAIYTLVLEDLCTSAAQTGQSSLLAHRTAMERIVASRGGLHNMGHSITLVTSLDRLIAIQVGQPPTYSTWESATLEVQRAALYPAIYGQFFHTPQDRRRLDEDIVCYCNEVNRAIEILEGEDWQFDGETKESTPEIFYLYYLRERVETKFAFLNARPIPKNTKDRCVLLAAKLVQYVVLMDDYIASTTLLVAHQLQKLLYQQDLRRMWQGWEDVFQWIAFVLACMPSYYTGKDWATTTCFESLQRTYGRRDWPTGWQERQLENLVKFVWSADRLDDAFGETCAKLETMSHHASKDSKS